MDVTGSSLPNNQQRNLPGAVQAFGFSVRCDSCSKWRLIPTKEKYEEILEYMGQNFFFCENVCEWRPGVSCDDTEDISPDSGGIWGFDELGTPQAPDGWQRLVHFRAEGSSQLGDVYYEAPSGKKLRSMPEVKKFLADHPEYMTDGVTLSRFSFKRPKSQESYVRKRSHAKSVEHKQGISVGRPAKKRATQSFLHKDAV